MKAAAQILQKGQHLSPPIKYDFFQFIKRPPCLYVWQETGDKLKDGKISPEALYLLADPNKQQVTTVCVCVCVYVCVCDRKLVAN